MNRDKALLATWLTVCFVRTFVSFPFVPRIIALILFWSIVVNLAWIPNLVLSKFSGWKVRIMLVLLLGLQLLLGVAVDLHFHSFMEGIH
jgi:hypothetical protein